MTMPLGLGPWRTAPSMRTSPSLACSKPAMIFISVDLPQPEGPTMATNSPSATDRLTPPTTGRSCLPALKLFLILLTTILASIAPPYRFESFEFAHDGVQHQADDADDDHAGDDQVVAVAGIARVHDQVAQA